MASARVSRASLATIRGQLRPFAELHPVARRESNGSRSSCLLTSPGSAREPVYLAELWLGRLATVDGRGRPHVVPTGFRLDPAQGVIDIGGRDLAGTKTFRDARANPRVAFQVDDGVLRSAHRVGAANRDGSQTRPGAPPVHRPVTCGR